MSAASEQGDSSERDRLLAEFAEHRAVIDATTTAAVIAVGQMLDVCAPALQAGGKLLLFGNGGSAADAQHIAAELVVRYKTNRPALAAIALTTDTSALTACSNDLGYDHIFSRQLEALGRAQDVAIGLSTSGNSANVINALIAARTRGLRTIGYAGCGGGRMAPLCDVLFVVPSCVTARIQEVHITVGHMFCKALEQRLGLC